MGGAGAAAGRDRRLGEGRPDAGEDARVPGAVRDGGAVPDAGPVRGRGVRVLFLVPAGGDGAGGRRQARRGSADRFRLPGHDQRRGPAAEAARAGVHRGAVAVLLRVSDVLADDGCGDRRLRGGVGVFRRHVQGARGGQSQAGGG